MNREKRDRVRRLLEQPRWWTVNEIAEALGLEESEARTWVRIVSRFAVIFCQHRTTQKYAPKEYRIFQKAIAVKAVRVQKRSAA